MNRQDQPIEVLIASYLAGEASPDEIAFVEQWKSSSKDNQRHFRQFQLIFENAVSTLPGEEYNADAAWEKIRKKLPKEARSISMHRPFNAKMLLRIAAGILLFVAAGVFVYRFANSSDAVQVRLASGDAMLSDTLAEGTKVFLNRTTTVGYTYAPESNSLTAELTGEAYFDINHDEEKVFVVQAEGTFIKDIGTAFNVRAYPDSNTVEVFVEEGEVVFYTDNNPGITLQAGGRGIYQKDARKFVVADPKPNITSYKSKVFTFNNHSLAAVVDKLNEVYKTQIEIGDNLKDCRITVSFNDESIEEIAQIIAETLEISVSESGNSIMLEGKGCKEVNTQ